MTKQRKIIVYIATSADGFIARPDGSVDWLNTRNAGDYGMGAFFKTIDTILWGHKTYGIGLEMNEGGVGVYGSRIKNYVFSRRPPKKHAPDVEFVREPISEFATRLRGSPGKDIWMMGGGGIIASFLDAGEIDEFIIHIIPAFIGEGIPLIAPKRRDVELKLLSVRDYPDGVVRLHYEVERPGKKPKAARKRGSHKGRSK
ncbi:MAG: dihydrofolate reductase family protein [Acidobacteriota bacterium]|nr:dihydrofolate reductase family protein [Acidobacteriota bacterium]